MMVFLATLIIFNLVLFGGIVAGVSRKGSLAPLLGWSLMGSVIGAVLGGVAASSVVSVERESYFDPSINLNLPPGSYVCGNAYRRSNVVVKDRLTGSVLLRQQDVGGPLPELNPYYLNFTIASGGLGTLVGLLAGGWYCRSAVAERVGEGERFLRELAAIPEPDPRNGASEKIRSREDRLVKAQIVKGKKELP